MSQSDSTILRVAVAGCHRQVTREPRSHNWAAAFAEVPETRGGGGVRSGSRYARRVPRRLAGDVGGTSPPTTTTGGCSRRCAPTSSASPRRQTHHATQIAQAAAAGVRGILCDKPFVTTLAEADAALEACRNAGVAIACGTEMRWDAAYRLLAQRLRDGLVGEVHAILAYGAPNLIFHGCHWYDTALLLAGDPEPLWVSGRVDAVAADEPDEGRRLDPPGRAWVGLDNGVLLTLLPEGGGRGFSVIGSGGRLEIVNDAHQAYLWGGHARRPRSGPSRRRTGSAGGAAVRRAVAARRHRGARSGACGAHPGRHAGRRAPHPPCYRDRLCHSRVACRRRSRRQPAGDEPHPAHRSPSVGQRLRDSSDRGAPIRATVAAATSISTHIWSPSTYIAVYGSP